MKLREVLIEDTLITSVANLRAWCSEWVPEVKSRHIFLLEGPMGVGKTELVRAVLEAFRFQGSQSPSFNIIHHYETPRGPVDHVDLYRIQDEDDLESTGFWDLFRQVEGFIFIEWADRLQKDALPLGWAIWKIEFAFAAIPQNGRVVRRYELSWTK